MYFGFRITLLFHQVHLLMSEQLTEVLQKHLDLTTPSSKLNKNCTNLNIKKIHNDWLPL